MADILALEAVSSGYGESVVVDDLSLRLEEGESLALLGRNGVGKTTLLATVMGLTRFWKMPVKQHTNMTTLHTCWTMTVESANDICA